MIQPEAAGSSHEFPGSGQEIMILFQCDRNDALKAETSKCYKKNVIVTYSACFYEKYRCYFTKGSGTKLTEAIIFRLLEKIIKFRRWDRFLFTVLDEVQFLLQIGSSPRIRST